MTPAAATTDPADPADPDLPACCICLQACSSSSSSTHTLECGHVFHTDCIVAWFRTRGNAGTCPMCRADPSQVLTFPDAYARCSMLRRKARSSSAPAELKRAVARIQRAEQKEKEAMRESREFSTAETRRILQTHRRLRQKKWAARRAVHAAKRQLGLTAFPGFSEIPMLARAPPQHLHFMRRLRGY